LACFLLVALSACFIGALRTDRRRAWFVAAGLIAGALATTYSRAVVLTLVAMFGIAFLARAEADARRLRRELTAVAAIAFLAGAVAFGNGWVTRGKDTSTGQNIDRERVDYAREAWRLTRDHPLLGVGPGRYTIALESIPNKSLLPAHNIVLFEGAEGGVLAGILAGLLLIAVAVRAARLGAGSAQVFCALVFFLLLDAYPYTFSTGIAISGLWLGLLELAAEPQAIRG
jgi:O-antigen ligase